MVVDLAGPARETAPDLIDAVGAGHEAGFFEGADDRRPGLARNLLLVGLVGSAWRSMGDAPESQECSNDRPPAASPTPRAPISSGTPTAA